MIAIILLTVFGGLFAAMAIAPLAIEESERAEAARRHERRPAPVTLSTRKGASGDHEAVAA